MQLLIDELKENQIKKLKKRLKILDKYVKESKLHKDFLTITFINNEQYLKFRERKFSSLLNNLKKNYGVDSFFWVVEFQKRGVIHFHILLLRKDTKKIGFIDRKKKYKDLVGHTTIKSVYTSVIKYLTKYIQKDIVRNRKKLYIYTQHPILHKEIKKEIRYRQYSIGGNIRKMREYKELMKKEFQKRVEKIGLEIRKEYGWKYIQHKDTKVSWRFQTHFDIEGLEIKKCIIQRYERKWRGILETYWEFEYEYEILIEKPEDFETVYKIILLELGFLN